MTESAEPSAWIPIQGQLRRVTSEDEILEIAMGLAADRGDPFPSLIQHTRCTRAEANRVACQAVVPGDRESYLIAVQGRFTVEPRRRRWDADDAFDGPPEIYSVMTLIVDAATGAPTDSGFSNEYPELAATGVVVTDYRTD